jgi:hypothetical protein
LFENLSTNLYSAVFKKALMHSWRQFLKIVENELLPYMRADGHARERKVLDQRQLSFLIKALAVRKLHWILRLFGLSLVFCTS